MSKVSVTIKGGNFKAGGELRAAIEAALSQPIQRAALTVQGSVQRTTPVRTGTLRRSWNTGAPTWEGSRLQTKVGTAVVYARKVDAVGRSAGYIHRGLAAAQSEALAKLRAGARDIGANVWKKG